MKIRVLHRLFFTERGFTLVEIALVITVIGLLLTFGLSAWMSMKTSQQISATLTTLKTSSSCLGNYVIHSATVPPQTYFAKNCTETDAWGRDIVYYNNGDDIELTSASTKTVRDSDGDHPDGLWLLVSSGPNGVFETTSNSSPWDCSTGDDLCHFTSKNALIYETKK
ncbi:type II secretion system protein [Desulforhopalus sp. 52FAK]